MFLTKKESFLWSSRPVNLHENTKNLIPSKNKEAHSGQYTAIHSLGGSSTPPRPPAAAPPLDPPRSPGRGHACTEGTPEALLHPGGPQWRKVLTTCSIRRRQSGQVCRWDEHCVQQHMWPHLERARTPGIQRAAINGTREEESRQAMGSLRDKDSVVLLLQTDDTEVRHQMAPGILRSLLRLPMRLCRISRSSSHEQRERPGGDLRALKWFTFIILLPAFSSGSSKNPECRIICQVAVRQKGVKISIEVDFPTWVGCYFLKTLLYFLNATPK